MIEITEKCYSCNKANSIPKWGWIWPCYDDVCNYEPIPTIDEIQAKTEVARDADPLITNKR